MRVSRIHAQVVGERNNAIIPNAYIALVDGDYVAAVVLKEIVYWSEWAYEHGRDGWFYRQEPEWQERCWLSRKQVNRGIGVINARAEEVGDGTPLIETATRKMRTASGALLSETATHYRINPAQFEALMETVRGVWIGDEGGSPSGDMGSSRNVHMGNSGNVHLGNSGNVQEGSSRNVQEGKSFSYAAGTCSGDVSGDVQHPSDAGASRGGHATDILMERFERWWHVYPRKVGKDAARKAWRKRRPSEALTEEMIEAVERQKLSPAWTKDGGQFIPHPSTWLNQGRWEDEVEVEVAQKPQTIYERFGPRVDPVIASAIPPRLGPPPGSQKETNGGQG